MLRIENIDLKNNYRILDNSPNMFHEALIAVLKGEKRFHVEDSFDLVYEDNDIYTKNNSSFPNSDFYLSEVFFPPYYFYNENDTDKINLDLFEGFDEIFFEEVNEYTIVISQLVLKHTNMSITFKDNKINLINYLKEKVSINDSPRTNNHIYVQSDFYGIYTNKNHYCTIGLFHNLFILQWLTDLPKKDIKYLSLSIRKTEGIGSILSTYNIVEQAMNKLGIKTFIEPNCTRFSNELLSKYFVFTNVPDDADKTNTAYVKCFNSFVLTHFIQRYTPKIDQSILQPEFLSNIEEYADHIIADKKVLGVLLRGTDYIIANYVGNYRPVPIEECIEVIEQRIKQYNYEKVFVATEDSDFLQIMIDNFPNQVITVSQERHNLSEFKNIKYISDLEKNLYQGKEYLDSVEDTTVNYYYAIYLLSRCESLISNCMCSAVNIAKSFNHDKYTRVEILSDKYND